MYTDKRRRYQVITFAYDCGQDEKLEYSSVRQAKKAIRAFWPEYDGWGIWDRINKRYVSFAGAFPQP